jgi:hypothetical protein
MSDRSVAIRSAAHIDAEVRTMLWNASALNGYAIETRDGLLGTVSDLLFEDVGWAIRWLVVDTGNWLPVRKVLLPLSALGQPDRALGSCAARTAQGPSRRRVEASGTAPHQCLEGQHRAQAAVGADKGKTALAQIVMQTA